MGVSISSVGAKQAKYYIDAVAKGREDYYSGYGEAKPTEFKGRLDSVWEAPREVSTEEASERWALRGEDDRRKVVAFDMTFSVPKSVSVLWATGDAETRATIEKTHRMAMEAAIGSMEWYSREGAGGGQCRQS